MPLNISRDQGKITIQYDQEVKRFFCACAFFFAVTTSQTGLVQRRWWILCLPEASSSLRCETQLEKLATCAQWLGWAGKLLSIVTNVDKMIIIIRIIIAITGGQPEIFNNNRTQQSTGSCLSLGRNPSQVQKQMVYCEGRVKRKKLNGRRTPHCK